MTMGTVPEDQVMHMTGHPKDEALYQPAFGGRCSAWEVEAAHVSAAQLYQEESAYEYNCEPLATVSEVDHLTSASANNMFLWEDYGWIDGESLFRNSTKPIAKIRLTLLAVQFTYRMFASDIS